MGPRMKPCPHPNCDKLIVERCNFCRKHTNWTKIAKKRKNSEYKTIRLCKKCGKKFNITSPQNIHCKKCRTYKCKVCNKNFTKSITDDRVTCSKKCSKILNSPPTLICERCNKKFPQREGRPTKYCGKKCRYLSARIDESTTQGSPCATSEYRHWRKSVLERDNYTCQYPNCNTKEELHTHHIKPRKDYPELKYNVSNGITLCYIHHGKVHGQKWKPSSTRIKRPSQCAKCKKEIKGFGKSPALCRSCALKRFYKNKKS